ncbi:hypothetical protein H5410_035311 [Solanum commersonii]|uniref:Uncharacterized protein n=1 Tax=Solanum commersonii TaxID=4109 RepID=A0A9J5Y2I7_SOLCO|nr:hypothetical protein H5410_035311 [Solanum commersonii]
MVTGIRRGRGRSRNKGGSEPAAWRAAASSSNQLPGDWRSCQRAAASSWRESSEQPATLAAAATTRNSSSQASMAAALTGKDTGQQQEATRPPAASKVLNSKFKTLKSRHGREIN